MASVDFRTRFEGDEVPLDTTTFLRVTVPPALAANGPTAGQAAVRLGLQPLTLDVDGEVLTIGPTDNGLVVRPGGNGGVTVALAPEAFSGLMQEIDSTFGVRMTGRAVLRTGDWDSFVAWEPVLRCLLDGRPVYEPGTITFCDRDGGALDLQRSFTLDDDPADLGHFLTEAGYLHVEGVFSEAEMAAVSAELDEAIAAAERDDGASWWARTVAGEWYASRILGFNQKSPALRELLHSDRFARLGTLTDDRFRQRDPDVGDSAEGLLKTVGVVEGISDVNWHKDCSMGGHSRRCCGLTVGISVTGAGPENGELGAVAGSHRANISPTGVAGLDLPQVPLPTRTGDVTVHCSCTLHMSRPPVSAERRVVYTGFHLARRPGDEPAVLTEDEMRRARAALNDHVRRQQNEQPTARIGSFEI